MIYGDGTTMYSKYEASDLWKQLELASEFESYLQDTVEWGSHSLLSPWVMRGVEPLFRRFLYEVLRSNWDFV